MSYFVELPDGRNVEFPDSVPRDKAAEIIRQQLGGPKAAPSAPSSIGDIATAFGLGAVGSTKALTDVAGADNAASRALGDVSESLSRAYTPQRQAEIERRQQLIKEAEKSGSTWEEIKANLGAVAEAPSSQLLKVWAPLPPTQSPAVLVPLPNFSPPPSAQSTRSWAQLKVRVQSRVVSTTLCTTASYKKASQKMWRVSKLSPPKST